MKYKTKDSKCGMCKSNHNTKKAKSKEGVKSYTKKGLTPAQIKKMDNHSIHHTKKHMNMMSKYMREGMSFSKAHTETKKLEKTRKKRNITERVYENKPKDSKAKMNKTIVEKPATHSRVRKGKAMTNFKANNY